MTRKPLDRLRRLCLALPDAWEKVSHGEPTFWVGKKMFASFANRANHHGAGRDAVWSQGHTRHAGPSDRPITGALLQAAVDVGPSGWIGVDPHGPTVWADVAERLCHAHDLAAPTRARSAKAGEPARSPPSAIAAAVRIARKSARHEP